MEGQGAKCVHVRARSYDQPAEVALMRPVWLGVLRERERGEAIASRDHRAAVPLAVAFFVL